jgi:hypothetical protein
MTPEGHEKLSELFGFAAKALRLVGSAFPQSEPYVDAAAALLGSVSSAMRVQGKTIEEILLGIHMPRNLAQTQHAAIDGQVGELPSDREITRNIRVPVR